MSRSTLALAALVLLPGGLAAQPRILLGGGFSAPNGAITDVADPGYHVQAGLQVRLPMLSSVALRGDGSYHRMGASSASFAGTDVLGGSLSLVVFLPGISLQPYLLGGLGSYRTETGAAEAPESVTDTGYHGGFGVAVGGTGVGAFAEIRYVQIDRPARTRVIPLTLGLRF